MNPYFYFYTKLPFLKGFNVDDVTHTYVRTETDFTTFVIQIVTKKHLKIWR